MDNEKGVRQVGNIFFIIRAGTDDVETFTDDAVFYFKKRKV